MHCTLCTVDRACNKIMCKSVLHDYFDAINLLSKNVHYLYPSTRLQQTRYACLYEQTMESSSVSPIANYIFLCVLHSQA